MFNIFEKDCISISNLKGWNPTSIDCYTLKCDCRKCNLYNIYFKLTNLKCKMKYYVVKLLEKYGEPVICPGSL